MINKMDDFSLQMNNTQVDDRPPPPTFSSLFRYSVISYLITILLVGLPGNILVICATLKYKQFRSDRVSVVLIRYLGIIGCALIVLLDIPAIIHFLYGWPFEKPGCYVFVVCEVTFGAAQFYIVAAITIHRLVRCTRPIYAGLLTEFHAHCIAMAMCCIAALEIPLLAVLFFQGSSRGSVVFNSHTKEEIGCAFRFGGIYVVLQKLLDHYVPLVACIMGNLFLWVFAIAKSKFQIHLRPIITVTILSVLLIVCWLPPILRFGFTDKFKPHVLILDDYPFFLRMGMVFVIPIVFIVLNRPFARFVKQFMTTKFKQAMNSTKK